MTTEEIKKKLKISIVTGGQSYDVSTDTQKFIYGRNEYETALLYHTTIEAIIQLSRINNDVLYETMDVSDDDTKAIEELMDKIAASRTSIEFYDGVFCHFYSQETSEKKMDNLVKFVVPAIDSVHKIAVDGFKTSTFDGFVHFHCVHIKDDKYRFYSYITLTDMDATKFKDNILNGINILFNKLSESKLINNGRMLFIDLHEPKEANVVMYTVVYSFDCIYNAVNVDINK